MLHLLPGERAEEVLDDALGVESFRQRLVDALGNLLKANAPREAKTHTGNTPLLLAAAAGRTAVVRQLVAAGASLEARNGLGNTPLLAAVAGRQPEAARVLLELGADQRIRNSASQTARDLALQVGDPALASLFESKR